MASEQSRQGMSPITWMSMLANVYVVSVLLKNDPARSGGSVGHFVSAGSEVRKGNQPDQRQQALRDEADARRTARTISTSVSTTIRTKWRCLPKRPRRNTNWIWTGSSLFQAKAIPVRELIAASRKFRQPSVAAQVSGTGKESIANDQDADLKSRYPVHRITCCLRRTKALRLPQHSPRVHDPMRIERGFDRTHCSQRGRVAQPGQIIRLETSDTVFGADRTAHRGNHVVQPRGKGLTGGRRSRPCCALRRETDCSARYHLQRARTY